MTFLGAVREWRTWVNNQPVVWGKAGPHCVSEAPEHMGTGADGAGCHLLSQQAGLAKYF